MNDIPEMKLTRALRPKSLEMYNLRDICEWVKHGWPELKDVDYFQFVQDEEMNNGSYTRLEYAEDILLNDDEWEYYVENDRDFDDTDRENLILFYRILKKEFGDCYIAVDW